MKTVYKPTLKRALCLAVAVCSASLALSAQDGSTAYNFLNVTSSARIYGLGGVNISTVYDDVMIADQNPALLGQEMSGQLGLNYMSYLGGSNFAGAAYARKVGDYGTWSAAIRYFGYGEMKGADESGNLTGSFSPKDMAISGSYSHDFTDRIRGGFTVKFLYSNYEQYTALALATDLGVNYYNDESDLSVSAVVANLGGQIKRFDQRYDKLPVDIRLGLSKGLSTMPLTLSVTAWNLTKWKLPFYDAGDGTMDSKPVLKDKF
ncbi:MAG: type IX secretion system protein PorQ, partial [Muribaculaceae bacterium]|nr:type IX secretion system protein PorQ [Muribaculaceae bacterium]